MEAKLKVQNCYSWLKTDNEKLKERLWRALRFRRKNYFHTSLYKRGVWDGYDEFFKKHTGRFLTGLLPEVEYALDHLKVPYKMIDQRDNVQFRFKDIDKTFLTQWRPEGHDLKEMHDYQVDLVNQVIKYKRGIIQAPTACHGRGQKVLMFDGSLKAVEYVVVGDKLMGPDSKPRTVIEVHAGRDDLYEIKPHHGGESFTANSNHILTLQRTKLKKKPRWPSEFGEKIVDVSVKEYLSWSKWRKHTFKLVRTGHKIKRKATCKRSKFEVRHLGVGDYFGFTLQEEPHYLLGDSTITHNSGKTAIMIGILKALPQSCPTLILANKKSLVKQNYDELQMWGFENVGRLYERYNKPDTFTCATVQSLHKFQDLGEIRALVVDEIHDMVSKIPKQYYNKLKACSVRAAVSATPFKFGGSDKSQKYSVKGYFGPILVTDAGDEKGRLTTKKLQDREILATADCFFYPITTPKIPYEIYLDAVTFGIAENWHFHQVVKRLCEKKLRGRTLIIVERIAHGDVLEEIISGALWVRGEDTLKTREKIINQLKYAKEDTIAIATQGIFNTGINVKIHNLVNAAGGQAEHQIIQRLGRGLRKADDKDKLDYYDFTFRINDYLEQHSNKRIRILRKEGHNVTVLDEIDF